MTKMQQTHKRSKKETGREETETWQADRGLAGNRQRHGRHTEDMQGRDRDMVDRQRTGREDTQT